MKVTFLLAVSTLRDPYLRVAHQEEKPPRVVVYGSRKFLNLSRKQELPFLLQMVFIGLLPSTVSIHSDIVYR